MSVDMAVGLSQEFAATLTAIFAAIFDPRTVHPGNPAHKQNTGHPNQAAQST